MNKGIKRILVTSLSICMVLILLVSGCGTLLSTPISEPPPSQSTQPTPEVSPKQQVYTATSAPSSPVEVQLSLSDSPLLGKQVQVIFTFGLAEPFKRTAANTTARITLPHGFELVSGKLDWQGDVLPGTRYEIRAMIKAVKYGDFKIEARAFYHPNAYDVTGGSAYIWALVHEDYATVSDRASHPTETPHAIPIAPPTEKPPKPPAEPGDIAPEPPSLHPPPSSDLTLGGATLANPLVITGGFSCNISGNALPPNQQTESNDVNQGVVWGAVRVFDTLDNYLGQILTGSPETSSTRNSTVPASFALSESNA